MDQPGVKLFSTIVRDDNDLKCSYIIITPSKQNSIEIKMFFTGV